MENKKVNDDTKGIKVDFGKFFDEASKITDKALSISGDIAANTLKTSMDITSKALTKSTETVVATKDKVMEAMDVNGDGRVDIEDIIIMGVKTPGVKISRAEFLQKEFSRKYSQDIIDEAIRKTPASAGISSEDVDKVADEVIQYERMCVSGIATALGTPGGFAMAATIPADIAQYYGYMLRAAQKLMYLYGFPEIDSLKGQNIDTETMNVLIICLGAMYGVHGSNSVIKAMAKALAIGVEKKLVNAALTKGTIYPIVKSVASWFGKRMTKQIFAGFFKKAIPVVGGVVGGGITYASFKPCCDRLKASLQNTMLSNLDYVDVEEDNLIIENETV